ncbi:MAG: FTR1 family protein [Isosphaeraceae bacterium]|nr:FTR1 family protein [Isosphaeraceae bacterium]
MLRTILPAWLLVIVAVAGTSAAEVSGRVVMPDVCAPEVSPAVVTLEPKGNAQGQLGSTAQPTEVKLVDQRGLQFVPRVQAMHVGETLRFTNQDSETHNVHIVSPGFAFNESMAPGQPRDYVPDRAGVIRLACDIHSHMRGYVVVSATPWVQVCTRLGRFRLDDVPEGHYTLTVWHEMGEPLVKEITVEGKAADLGTLTLTVPRSAAGVQAVAPVLSWPDVIDRISVLLSSSLDAATRPGGFKKARKLAEDAYWGEFEASEMETAVRTHLGFARAGAVEELFRGLVPAARELSEGRTGPESFIAQTRQLLLSLDAIARDLNQKGISDRTRIFAEATTASAAPAAGDHKGQVQALKRAFLHVRELADQGEPEDAASAMTAAYWDQFEPLERYIEGYDPQSVRTFEVKFNNLRGKVGAKLKGEALGGELAALATEVEATLARFDARSGGRFLPAFGASLVTILREGVEVILILTMLLALVAKTGQVGARRAIWTGVGLAAVASLVTAAALNRLVASAQGKAGALVEGGVMLAASGVLFYVSYWLISRSESKRWMDFLKERAAHGAELGGLGTLTLMAFLAVYREGAETALMYQAMIGIQAHSQPGLAGLAAGLGAGLVLLALIAVGIRATSVRLPLRMFFTLTGVVLFGMAVVFAGDGVFELQEAGILRTTQVGWLGTGLPTIGVHPNVQALSVQGLLVAGALLALVLTLAGGSVDARPATVKRIAPPATGVGV